METTNTVSAGILSRIQKLLALASSDNVHEAAAAMARAQELLFQHKLSMADLELSTGEKESVGRLNVDEETALQLKWKGDLLASLAFGGYCKTMRLMGGRLTNDAGNRIARIVLIGKPTDTQTVAYLYQVARNEIDRLCAIEGKGKGFAWANSFRVGAVVAIWQRMQAQRAAQTRPSAAVSETALTVISRGTQEVDAYFKKEFPRTRTIPGARASRGDGFAAGKAAGAGINLSGGGKSIGAASKQIRGGS